MYARMNTSRHVRGRGARRDKAAGGPGRKITVSERPRVCTLSLLGNKHTRGRVCLLKRVLEYMNVYIWATRAQNGSIDENTHTAGYVHALTHTHTTHTHAHTHTHTHPYT